MTGNVARCDRGHVIKPHRDYKCPDCGQHMGPCRCRLFDHVMERAGKDGHRVPTPILGGGFRVTYHPERLDR